MDKELFKQLIKHQKTRLGHLQIDTVDKQIHHILEQISKVQTLTIILNYQVLKETFSELLDLGLNLKETNIRSGEHTYYDFTFL